MHRIALIILHAFIAQASSLEPATKLNPDSQELLVANLADENKLPRSAPSWKHYFAQAYSKRPMTKPNSDSQENLVDNIADEHIGRLADRAQLSVESLKNADLESTALGKPGQVAIPCGRHIVGQVAIPCSRRHIAGKSQWTHGNRGIPSIQDNSRNCARILTKVAAGQKTAGVCTNKSCKKIGSSETVTMLEALASTHSGIQWMHAENSATANVPAMTLQKEFAWSCIEKTGCLGNCGLGPNVVNMGTGQIHRGVLDPASAQAVLEGLGLHIPLAAERAYEKFMKAQRAVYAAKWSHPGSDEGKMMMDKAVELLTAAIDEVGMLRVGGALLLYLLFEARADVYKEIGNLEAARQDQSCAEYMTTLRYPAADCVETCTVAEHDLGTNGCNPLHFGLSPCQEFCGFAPA